MTRRQAPALLSHSLLDGLRPFVLLQNILTYYVDLPCFMIMVDEPKTWHVIVTPRRKNTPIDYENFELWEARIRYNEAIIKKVAKEKKAVCLPFQGVYGLFVPVLQGGRCVAVLQSGAFLRELPKAESLAEQWRKLTGRYPGQHDRDWVEYVRAITDTAILEPAVLEGLQKTLECMGAALSGSLSMGAAAKRLDELQLKVFAPKLWHRQWVDWQVIQKKFFRFNSDPKSLMAWEKAELGIRRFPSTVLAAKRSGTGQEWTDWLASLEFQRAALKIAPELGETLAYPLHNYGVLLLSSADPGLSAPKARAQIREKAARFAERMSQRLGCKVWIGAGRHSSSGIGLPESYQDAIVALHLAVAQDRPFVAYQEAEKAGPLETGLRHKLQELTRALLEEPGEIARRRRSLFVQDLLKDTGGRPEAMRRLFLEALHRMLESLEKRRSIPAKDLADFESESSHRLEMALNLNELVQRFEESSELLMAFLAQPIEGDKYFRLRQAREALLNSLQEPWSLASAARQAGFSVTSFSREFARFAGQPFSDFLLAQRLEKAKRLLEQPELSLNHIAEACGFRSTNYFQQIFKKRLGRSPGQFRLSGHPKN